MRLNSPFRRYLAQGIGVSEILDWCPDTASYFRIPVRFPFFLLLALRSSQIFLRWRSCYTRWRSKSLGWRRSFRLIVVVGFCTRSRSLAWGYWLQVRRLWGVWRSCRRCRLCIDPWHRLTLQLRGSCWWQLCNNSWHGATSGWLGLSELQEHKLFAQRNE